VPFPPTFRSFPIRYEECASELSRTRTVLSIDPEYEPALLIVVCVLCVITGVIQPASNYVATWPCAIDWLLAFRLFYMTPLPRAN